MKFAENLKTLRRERNLSQEELAELLDVSRQAVSKWELEQGYPEAETLLLLSRQLNVSLDWLMGTQYAPEKSTVEHSPSGNIIITSPHENVIATCYKINSSYKMKGGTDSPKFALYGISHGLSTFWGEPTTFLGWYADEDSLTKEVQAIHTAIKNGVAMYTLQYSVKVERHLLGYRIIET